MTPVTFSQMRTPGGYLCGECASALQKSIRRGDERGALFWSSELDLAGYGNYVWKRLRIIASEDVGLADTDAVVAVHRRERTRTFAAEHETTPIRAIGDEHVAAWLKGGRNAGTVKFLCTFFSDAASVPAGRLVDRNPFAQLGRIGVRSSRGRRDKQPPNQAQVATLVAYADELTPPSFAAYLDVAAHMGMRPGELDALRWSKLDFQADTILVDEQWEKTTRTFTEPKHHHVRTIALTAPAKKRLLSLPHESEFAFTTVRGTHYCPSTRAHHWNRVRAAAGLGNVDLYTCTRHYFGWYAWNVLELDARDIALHFGHQDGGELVRKLYGHPDAARARERVREAFRQAPTAPVPLAPPLVPAAATGSAR